jgi:murein DD-endopeptidase MepM/ murein hydrolase activator NlpD
LNKTIRVGFLLLFILVSVKPVFAQEETSGGPVYYVKPGDTLWTIARNLHVPYGEMLELNGLTESSSIIPGTELKIPGLNDITGVLSTARVPYGETLQSLSRRYQVNEDTLIRLNRLTSPLELYVGVSAVLIGEEELLDREDKRVALSPAESSLELAIQENINPWTLVVSNGESGEWDLLPGEVLFVPDTSSNGPGGFPEGITKVQYSPGSLIQGKTMVFTVDSVEDSTITGSLGDYPLSFFTEDDTTYIALQGLHAKESVGLKPLSISGNLPDGTPFAHTQMVNVISGNYHYEDIVGVPQNTVGVEITEKETLELQSYATNATSTKYWNGKFLSPAPPELSAAYSSYFGGRRSYNGSGYFYYHSGLDYYSTMGGNIYAPAPGKVIYQGTLLLHGNTTMIDHGWGVYSLYAHQSEYLVNEGQLVDAGDLIGRVGNSGRSIGPHLHWEIWVGGIQVDPLDWTGEVYP